MLSRAVWSLLFICVFSSAMGGLRKQDTLIAILGSVSTVLVMGGATLDYFRQSNTERKIKSLEDDIDLYRRAETFRRSVNQRRRS